MPTQNISKALTDLLKKLGDKYKPTEPDPLDPVTQLIVSYLTMNATSKQAVKAHSSIMADLIDNNDVRVCFSHELVSLIGENYPDSWERIARMREALNEVYVREHDIRMSSVESSGKKEQRHYLDTLPGMLPYVAAQITLLCFGGHAMPVDDKLLTLLHKEEALPEDVTDTAAAEAFLLRQIKASDALQSHQLFQAWSDDSKVSKPKSTAKAPAKPKSAAKSKTKASTKPETDTDTIEETKTTKKSAKKTTKKKTSKAKSTKKKTTKKAVASGEASSKTTKKKTTKKKKKSS